MAYGRADYAARDQEAQATFYVLLWKRKGISLAGFDDYWRDVHGPVCARLPGQFQYWQFHVAHNDTGIFPADLRGELQPPPPRTSSTASPS